MGAPGAGTLLYFLLECYIMTPLFSAIPSVCLARAVYMLGQPGAFTWRKLYSTRIQCSDRRPPIVNHLPMPLGYALIHTKINVIHRTLYRV